MPKLKEHSVDLRDKIVEEHLARKKKANKVFSK